MTERNAGMLLVHPRPAPSHRWSSWLLDLAPRRPGRRRRRPPEARPQLLGHDLDGRSGAAILSGPAPGLESTQDHDPAALGQGLGDMLGLVPPHDHGEERRLLVPPIRNGHPEHGPGDPALGVADLGVVGEVAGEADAGRGGVLTRFHGHIVSFRLCPQPLVGRVLRPFGNRLMRRRRSVDEPVTPGCDTPPVARSCWTSGCKTRCARREWRCGTALLGWRRDGFRALRCALSASGIAPRDPLLRPRFAQAWCNGAEGHPDHCWPQG
jgi:hypothetical protein